jgi:hypothetical protein
VSEIQALAMITTMITMIIVSEIASSYINKYATVYLATFSMPHTQLRTTHSLDILCSGACREKGRVAHNRGDGAVREITIPNARLLFTCCSE